jgi:hypothetical protein
MMIYKYDLACHCQTCFEMTRLKNENTDLRQRAERAEMAIDLTDIGLAVIAIRATASRRCGRKQE